MIKNSVFMLFFAVKSGFQLAANGKTLIFAVVLAVCAITVNLLSLKIIERMDVITVGVFSGAGAIVLPFLFGTLFLNEMVTVGKILSFLLLLVVVIRPAVKTEKKKKRDWRGYLYGVLLFLVSGASTMNCKLYAVADHVMGTEVLCFWANVMILPYVAVALSGTNRHELVFDIRQMKKSAYVFAGLSVLFSNCFTLLEVYVLKHMDLVLYTLLNNPITFVLTVIFSRILYREKITREVLFNVGFSIVAIVLNSV